MSTPSDFTDTSLPGFSLIFSGNNLAELHVEALYRGDERGPDKIFAEGMKARRGHSDIIGHLCNKDGNFVSTTYDYRIAKQFPVVPNSKTIYVYVINPLEAAININALLKPAEKAGRLKIGGVKYFKAECEMAVPRAIKRQDIKGALKIKITYVVEQLYGAEATHRVTEMRTIESYTPNPNYVPTAYEHFLPSTSLRVTRLAIHGLSTVGLAIDAYSLYSLFKFGEKTGNPFLREGARISGGLLGAINLGTMFASYGANIGKPFGPYGLAVGGLVGGTAGSLIGYCGGGSLATALFDSKAASQAAFKETFDRPINYPGALMAICHSSQRALHPISSTEERYVRAIFGGVKNGIVKAWDKTFDHATHLFRHPIDYILNRLVLSITKMSIAGIRSANAFVWDATIVGVGSVEDGSYFMDPDLSFLHYHVKNNPKLYQDALARVNSAIKSIQDVAQKIIDSDGPERAEMGVELVFDIAAMCFFKTTRVLAASKILDKKLPDSTILDKISSDVKKRTSSVAKAYADVNSVIPPNAINEITRVTTQVDSGLRTFSSAGSQDVQSRAPIVITGRRMSPATSVASATLSHTILGLMQTVPTSAATISPALQLSTLTPAGIFHSLDTHTSVLSSRDLIAADLSAPSGIARDISTGIGALAQSLADHSGTAVHTQQLLSQASRVAASPTMVPSALSSLGYSGRTLSSPAMPSAVLFAHRPSVVSTIATRVNPAAAVPSALSAIGMGSYTMSQAVANFSAPRDTHAAQLFSRAEFHGPILKRR